LGNFSRFNSSIRARIVSKSSAARGRDIGALILPYPRTIGQLSSRAQSAKLR
jgi:hypothetical protein